MVSPYNAMGVFDSDKRPIAVAYEGIHSYDIEKPEREANARLIAAAPDLLALAKKVESDAFALSSTRDMASAVLARLDSK
jgi:hypothetical protein